MTIMAAVLAGRLAEEHAQRSALADTLRHQTTDTASAGTSAAYWDESASRGNEADRKILTAHGAMRQDLNSAPAVSPPTSGRAVQTSDIPILRAGQWSAELSP